MIPQAFKKRLTPILTVLFLFAFYSNVNVVIRNQEISRRLKEAKEETARLELANKKLNLLIDYYQTATYQELEARRRLGLKRPEETVYLVKGLPKEPSDSGQISDGFYEDREPLAPQELTNPQKWWRYFFGD